MNRQTVDRLQSVRPEFIENCFWARTAHMCSRDRAPINKQLIYSMNYYELSIICLYNVQCTFESVTFPFDGPTFSPFRLHVFFLWPFSMHINFPRMCLISCKDAKLFVHFKWERGLRRFVRCVCWNQNKALNSPPDFFLLVLIKNEFRHGWIVSTTANKLMTVELSCTPLVHPHTHNGNFDGVIKKTINVRFYNTNESIESDSWIFYRFFSISFSFLIEFLLVSP